jgi:hypothetical protein
MADQQDFEKLSVEIMAIDEKDVREPDMPVDEAIKENEIMSAAVKRDQNVFVAVNFNPGMIEKCGIAGGALRYTQAQLIAAIGEVKEAAALWTAEEPKGYATRKELIAALAYATRNVPDAQKAVKAVRKGAGGADMVMDLSSLVQLGKKYKAPLEVIKFDMALIDEAETLANRLGKLYASAFIEKGSKEAKLLRDRAFTYMRKIMGEILDAAEYVFRNEPEKLEPYHSAYRNRKRNPSNTGEKPEAAEMAVA